MQRRQFISVLGVAAILAWVPLAADAQQPNKLPRLGWLPTFAPTSPIYDGFRQGLRELGYVEGKNIIIETRWAEGNLDRLPELARELARLNVDVMLVGGDQGLQAAKEASTTMLADLALQNRLPAIFGFREFADQGGLISYGASFPEQYRRLAWYVDRILKGANPADVPIEQPTKFELVINLKTVKALGLTVPPPLLATADELIQ